MSLAVKHVDPLDTVAAQGKSNESFYLWSFSSYNILLAVSFDFDEEFAKEAPGYYFPTKVPGAQYKVCVLFQRRQCFKGDRCPFRHINERQVLCKHWLRGLCKRGDNCDFAHEYDLNRMQECQFFKNEGQCFPEADHQLLTNRGFLFLDELLSAPCDDVRVATFDPLSRQLRFAPPRALVVNDEPRPLVCFSDASQQPLVTATADHEMFVARTPASLWQKQTAASLVGESFQFLSSAAGGVAVKDSDSAAYSAHLGFDSVPQMTAYLELYGFWVASGGAVDESSVTFHIADKREQQFVRDRLATLGLSAGAVTVDDTCVVSDARFTRAYVAAYVHSLAPRSLFAEWVWHLPLEPLRAVLDGVCAAQTDAAEPGVLFASSVRFRDELVRALLHAGQAPTFERWQRGWRVTTAAGSAAATAIAAAEHGKSTGRTWCVDMSSAPGERDGFVVVRRATRVSAQQFARLTAAERELALALECGDDERVASARSAVRDASVPAAGPFDDGEWVVLEASRATIQGNCNNPDCLWKHVTPEDKERAAECQYYARGFCRHGPKCRNKHVKKVLCLNWLAGFCPQGPACEKAHPTIEMMQLLDGSLRVRNTEFPACVLCGEDGHTIQTCPQAQQQHQQQFQEQQLQQQQQRERELQMQQQQQQMPPPPMFQPPPMQQPMYQQPMHQPPMFQPPMFQPPMHQPPMFHPPPQHNFQHFRPPQPGF